MLYAQRYETLRQRLAAVRREAGLTQVELAERLGKGQSFVSKIESGERYLDVLQFVLWCESCGIAPQTVIAEI